MKCKNCGNELSDNAMFCGKCGTKVEKVIPKLKTKKCSQCGKELSKDELFCSSCGTKADEQTSSKEKNYENLAQGRSNISPTKTNIHSYQEQNTTTQSQPTVISYKPESYVPTRSMSDDNIIMGLRIASVVIFLGSLISGIVAWVKISELSNYYINFGSLGFTIFILSTVIGFLAMIFIDTNIETRKIRSVLEKQFNNKQ